MDDKYDGTEPGNADSDVDTLKASKKKLTMKDLNEMILELTDIVGALKAEVTLHRGTPDAHNPAFMTGTLKANWRTKTVNREE